MASTPMRGRQSPTRNSTPRNRGVDNNAIMNMRDDMKRVIEDGFNKKKLS